MRLAGFEIVAVPRTSGSDLLFGDAFCLQDYMQPSVTVLAFDSSNGIMLREIGAFPIVLNVS